MNILKKWSFLIFFLGHLTTVFAGLLHDAVNSGDLSQVALALKQIKKNEINKADGDGFPALHLAIQNRKDPIVNALLEAGADISVKARNGSTPLHLAAFEDLPEIFKALLELGSDINARDNQGRTIIYTLFRNKHMELLSTIRKWSIEKQIMVTDPSDVEILNQGLSGSYMDDFNAKKELESACKPKDFYLVVEPLAGFSNRLRAVASSSIIAMLTGRKLVVDWKILENEMPATWKQLFSSPSMTMYKESSLEREGCPLSVIESAWRGHPVIKNLGVQNRYDAATLEQLGGIVKYPEPIIYFRTSIPFWPHESVVPVDQYKRAYRQFYQSLKPASPADKEIEDFIKQYFTNKFPIGVHYRAWQAGPEDKFFVVKSDPENRYLGYFIDKMKEALTAHPNAIFFLATDDPNVKEKLSKIDELKGRVVTRNIEIERSTVGGQLNALVDWFLLGSTNYIIGTKGSSFSDEAAHRTIEGRKISIGENPFF